MSAATSLPAAADSARRTLAARVFSMPVVLAMALLCTLSLFGAKMGISDPDLWWHLRNASLLVQSGHFIHHDTLSFTVAGKPWVNFEWLAELPFYFASRWLGDRGIYLVMMLASGALVLGVYWLSWLRSREWTSAFLAAMVALVFMRVSLAPRPLLFGWLFLVAELGILWGLRAGRDFTPWLPLVFALWVNTHGSWFLGFGLMVLSFALGWFEGSWGDLFAQGWSPAQKRKLTLITIASFAALFLNPYGWRLVVYPADAILHHKLGMEYIAEWASLDFHASQGKIVLAVLFGMAVLQLIRGRRWALADLALALIAVWGAMTYVRLVFLAGLILPPLFAADLKGWLLAPYDPDKDRPGLNAGVTALLIVVMAFALPSEKNLAAQVAHDDPQSAVPYLRSLAGRGAMLNEYNWGGYLLWNAPELKTFVDPRTDIFVQYGVMADYAKAVRIDDSFAVLNRYGIQYVLLKKGQPLAYLLAHNVGWQTTYDDGQAMVFARIDPHAQRP